MMKGYWYIHALSLLIGIITAISGQILFIIVYLCWLIYLHVFARLRKHVVIIALIIFSLSFFYYSEDRSVHINEAHLIQKDFSGQIISPVATTEEKIEFTIHEARMNTPIIVKIFSDDNQVVDQLKYGAYCQLSGTLQVPSQATNPGQFDYQNYLQNKGINYELIIDKQSQPACHGESLLQPIFEFRQMMIQLIHEKLTNNTAQWLSALVFGDQSFIDSETIEIFRQWGLSHILAISGLHTGIIIAIIYFILVKLLITTREQAQLILILFLPLFALITGGEPSVWRASLMILLLLLFNRFKLHYQLLDIFSMAFILLITVDPHIIYHIGFQFSFLVTFALLISSRLLQRSESRLYQGFLISFIAQMIILPLQLHYFYTFQPLSILLNVIVVPYFTLFVIPYMFGLSFLLVLPKKILHIFDLLFVKVHELFILLLKFVHHTFDYPLLLGDITLGHLIIYYLLFFLFMKYFERLKLKRAFVVSVLLVGFLCGLAIRPYFSPIGTVTMLDIGQGDAFIIELPYRQGVFMVDIGSTVTFPDFETTDYIYNSIIQPYLNKRSIYSLDAIFLSHEHVDHYGSLPYIITDKHVKTVVVSPYFEWNESLKQHLSDNKIPIKEVNGNEQLIINDHVFHILSPEQNMNDANDNSLVIYTVLGQKSWLFTGDIEKRAENHLIKSLNSINVDILKVAHHGSNTSTQKEFLQAIKADIALISVGENNMYHHPANEVIETLEQENLTIYRTDHDGAVQYIYNNTSDLFQRFIHKK